MATDIFTIDSSRKAPRISVNKLGEYMTATPLRRRRIIQDQKRPKAFISPPLQRGAKCNLKVFDCPKAGRKPFAQ